MPTGVRSAVPNTTSRTNTSMSDAHTKNRSDNTTTINHLTNIKGNTVSQVFDKSTYHVPINNRDNRSQTTQAQVNLKGNIIFNNTTYNECAPTTTKETTVFSYKGGGKSEVPLSYNSSNYISTDHTSGATSFATNKNIIGNYFRTPGRTNITQVNPGEVTFNQSICDPILTKGGGVIERGNINMTKSQQVSKQFIGDPTFNGNKIQKNTYWLTENYVIQPLLSNGYSIYNNGKNISYPKFFCDSRMEDNSEIQICNAVKTPINNNYSDASIPVNYSTKNPNELLIMNSCGEYNNPMLFNSKKIINSDTNEKCY